jgi:glutamine synthetase
MELRSPDPSLNPYLAFSLIIAAGLNGIENNMTLPQAVDADLYTADESVTKQLTRLPDSLDKAIALAENSSFVKTTIGEELVSKFIAFKKSEAEDFIAAKDKVEFYKERYFKLI